MKKRLAHLVTGKIRLGMPGARSSTPLATGGSEDDDAESDQRAVARPLLSRRRPPRALQRDQPGLRDASRLARSNQDWHRLLGLCAITSTLVIDEDGCYNPRASMAVLNKVSEGELRFPLPVGFVFEDDKIVLDPDQEVQGAVRTVLEYSIRRRPTLQ